MLIDFKEFQIRKLVTDLLSDNRNAEALIEDNYVRGVFDNEGNEIILRRKYE